MASEADGVSSRRRALADSVSATVLDSPQTTTQALRRAVAANDDVPKELAKYVDKVHKHAYRVIDEDFEAMKRVGYDEDALFEITISAAVGAGMARLRAGLGAIEED